MSLIKYIGVSIIAVTLYHFSLPEKIPSENRIFVGEVEEFSRVVGLCKTEIERLKYEEELIPYKDKWYTDTHINIVSSWKTERVGEGTEFHLDKTQLNNLLVGCNEDN